MWNSAHTPSYIAKTGIHFTNDISIVIQIRKKFHSVFNDVVVKWLLWNIVARLLATRSYVKFNFHRIWIVMETHSWNRPQDIVVVMNLVIYPMLCHLYRFIICEVHSGFNPNSLHGLHLHCKVRFAFQSTIAYEVCPRINHQRQCGVPLKSWWH